MDRNVHKLNTPIEPPPIRRKEPPPAPQKPPPVDFRSILPPYTLTPNTWLYFYLLCDSRESTNSFWLLVPSSFKGALIPFNGALVVCWEDPSVLSGVAMVCLQVQVGDGAAPCGTGSVETVVWSIIHTIFPCDFAMLMFPLRAAE